jgi:hypothetical protein
VSTPRSPTPLITTPITPRQTTVTPEPPLPATRKTRWWPAAVGVVLAAGVALLLWRPWAPARDRAVRVDSVATPSATVPETTSTLPRPAAPAVTNPPPPVAAPSAEAAAVRDVRFVDPPATVDEGDTISLRVEVLDQRGAAMRNPVVWTSSDPRTATVRSDGSLTALAPGRVVVSATSGGRQSRVELEVVSAVASVSVTPAADTLTPAGSMTLKASARKRDGSEVSGAAIAWRSSDEAVAVVSSAGRVTALAAGSTTITATAAGRKGSSQITVAVAVVQAPAAILPPVQPAAEDAQVAVRDLVAAYARALEAKDMARVHALYPGMSPTTERQTRSALEEMKDLKVDIAPSAITVDGAKAQARVTGAWTYRGGKPLNINNTYRFERRGSGWVIVAIE